MSARAVAQAQDDAVLAAGACEHALLISVITVLGLRRVHSSAKLTRGGT
jgi:hypothetical protein